MASRMGIRYASITAFTSVDQNCVFTSAPLGAGAFPASRAGGLLHPLPPGPVPPARGRGCGKQRPGAHNRQRPAATAFPPEGGLRESSVPPAAGGGGRPPRRSRGDFPITPAGRERITKRDPRTVKPRSPESFPPPPSSRPRIQEDPPCPPHDLPSRGRALHSHTPNCTTYKAELLGPPKWVLRPGPALPPVPLSTVKELSAHTSYETRGGGGCV